MPNVEKLAEFDQTIIPWYGKSFFLFPSSFTSVACILSIALFSVHPLLPYSRLKQRDRGSEMTSHVPSEATTCTYRFLSSLDDHVPPTIPHIVIRQQPRQAKQSIAYDRERRPVEPPPIVQIEFSNLTAQETMTCLQSPYYFMTARLVTPDSSVRQPKLCDHEEDVLTGSVVSSLHRLKDVDNQDAGFFVFGDLAIKIPGTFRIHFSLYEIRGGQVINRESIATEPFTVYSPKQFPGPLESTFLSRTFADQGVRMRIRKEHRMHSCA
ncbi:hypothetical protein K450DRAFT_232599 [Umbelopsis ramanniana AG]|uniref:Velvet domain-containing protein n=1 Tax=Umbelopsis ramanniana AG TaxID=1314678 RepID=A0AAD5EDT2_UMBRA|nr:uncharacterized protein K450DRAFT_232599 [Umbelopsis ramanniana AG]KAI8581344.1 hypothetical protein K450DRAFT_232599 [Umbelopsis ramanniana AG]